MAAKKERRKEKNTWKSLRALRTHNRKISFLRNSLPVFRILFCAVKMATLRGVAGFFLRKVGENSFAGKNNGSLLCR
jgi:hypothetical protein